jgi:serine/alanine adding enzyme
LLNIQHFTTYPKGLSQSWKEFIQNHPRKNIFQSPQFFKVYEQTQKYHPVLTIAIRGNKIVGVLSGVIQKEYSNILGRLSARCIVFGGPIVEDNDPAIVEKLIKVHDMRLKNKAIYTQFRNLTSMSVFREVFEAQRYAYTPHLDIHIPLNHSFEELKKSIHKSRKRNFTKSINKGSQVKELNNEQEVTYAYQLLVATYRRNKLPLPDFSHFLALWHNLTPKGYCLFLGIYYDNKMIGCRIVLPYGNMIYDYYAGSDFEHRNMYANDVLILETLKWGCSREKYQYFDFGGAGKPGIPYGVRDHKMKFSDNLVEYGRFEKVHDPRLLGLAKAGFKVWRKLRSK